MQESKTAYMRIKILIRYISMLSLSIALMRGEFSAAPKDREVVLGVSDASWPPYIIRHAGNEATRGIMVDAMRGITSGLGYRLTIRAFPEKRSLSKLADGEVDAHSKAKEWVDSPERYIWSDPVVHSIDRLVFLKSRQVVFDRPEDLFGKHVATILGYGYPLLEPYFVSGRILRDDVKSGQVMLLKLNKGRGDAGIITEIVALWLIRQHPEFKDKFAFSKKRVGKAPYRFMFTAKHNWKPFVAQFNRELAKMKKDGRLERILSRYK